jgi:hypothetical protein
MRHLADMMTLQLGIGTTAGLKNYSVERDTHQLATALGS